LLHQIQPTSDHLYKEDKQPNNNKIATTSSSLLLLLLQTNKKTPIYPHQSKQPYPSSKHTKQPYLLSYLHHADSSLHAQNMGWMLIGNMDWGKGQYSLLGG
jgi:hypothetical protein